MVGKFDTKVAKFDTKKTVRNMVSKFDTKVSKFDTHGRFFFMHEHV